MNTSLTVCIAQVKPRWMDKASITHQIIESIHSAAAQDAELIVFGEAFLPGYPFWVSATHGAEFNSSIQKELYAFYAQSAVCIEEGDLNAICSAARENAISVYLGIIERPLQRGGHSLYCSLVYISEMGVIESVHRKLQPTYEERLVWAQGDGNGLKVHKKRAFTLGGLNCWENWMPLTRASLYGMGENVHIAVWPGSDYNTKDITRFIARESRSYVISASPFISKEDISEHIPHRELILQAIPDILANGGSCIAKPDGEWLIPPQVQTENLIFAQLEYNKVLEERQNFDAAGHYSRPDVTKLILNQERQSTLDVRTTTEQF